MMLAVLLGVLSAVLLSLPLRGLPLSVLVLTVRLGVVLRIWLGMLVSLAVGVMPGLGLGAGRFSIDSDDHAQNSRAQDCQRASSRQKTRGGECARQSVDEFLVHRISFRRGVGAA